MDEVAKDGQGELGLEVVIGGVREDGDAEAQRRRPPQVGQEPEPAAPVVEEVGVAARAPAIADDAEGVPGGRAGVRRPGPSAARP